VTNDRWSPSSSEEIGEAVVRDGGKETRFLRESTGISRG
jgi:hypothetical protein